MLEYPKTLSWSKWETLVHAQERRLDQSTLEIRYRSGRWATQCRTPFARSAGAATAAAAAAEWMQVKALGNSGIDQVQQAGSFQREKKACPQQQRQQLAAAAVCRNRSPSFLVPSVASPWLARVNQHPPVHQLWMRPFWPFWDES
jgi:hypothetical protein